MEQNRFWDLLAKKKSGEATPEEQLELKQYFSQNPALTAATNQIDILWNSSFKPDEEISNQQTALAWSNIMQKISNPAPAGSDTVITEKKSLRFIRMFYRIIAAASILFILISTGWFLILNQKKEQQVKQNVVSTKNGSKSKIELPDGTKVWLNAGSKLIYDDDYGKESRNLELEGEAFFDVVHNKNMPLVIKTRHMNVKVLGTAFNVRAYPGDVTSEAALIRGAIEVSFPDRPMEKLLLKPQQKITIVNRDAILNNPLVATRSKDAPVDQESIIPVISVSSLTYNKKDSAVIETSWLNNKLIFRKKELGELSKDIERWFNVTVYFEDSSLIGKRFTGTFHNENIQEALVALQLTYPFHFRFEKNNNTVFIYR